MIPKTLAPFLLALVAGCGGSGSNGSRASFDPDAFLGTWAGTYQERAGARRGGTLRLTIQKNYYTNVKYLGGTGALVDSARGEAGLVTLLMEDGRLEVSYRFGPEGGMYSYAGTPRIDSRGHLVAALKYDYEGKTLVNDVDLAPVTP